MAVLKSSCTSILLVLLSVACYSQDVAGHVRQKWEAYHAAMLQEKMYVHTDKNTYVAGEIIWLKIYNVDAAKHTPLSLSKVAYVDVLDASNKAVAQAKIALKEGSGSGSVLLPLGAASGNYILRGYTNWMKNFGAGTFFEKPVTIINTLKSGPTNRADTADAYQISLFPEGGNLVAGVESKVAVKVTGPGGKGTDFTGAVLNENGDTISSVRSLQFGTATFLVTPVQAHTYSLVVTLPSGRRLKKAFPEIFEKGYVMRVTTANGRVNVAVKAGNSMQQGAGVYLFVHNRNTLQLAERKEVVSGQTTFSIDTGKLEEGISHFTLFDAERRPVCERLYFKRPAQRIRLMALPDQATYGTRKKATISLQANTDSLSHLDLSLSVYKWDSLQALDPVNVQSYLWLTSELAGFVEAPDFYFSDNAGEAADLLMLTKGWRRFKWESVLADKPAFSFPLEYNGHLIKAQITDLRTGKPAARIPAFLSIPGHPFQFYAAQSDSTGIAQFDVKHYYGPGEVIFQTNFAFDSIYRIEALSPFAQQGTMGTGPRFTAAAENRNALVQQSIGMQVQHMYRRDSIDHFQVPEAYDTIPFYGRPDYSYMLDVYTRFGTMEEVLREYVRPINVVQRRGGLHMLILDDARRQFFEGGELVLLDGIAVFNKNKMFAYDPLKVKKIDVVARKYFVGPTFFNGIASFTTYTGKYEGFSLDPRSIIIDYEGLQLEREFYAPVYETESQYKSRIPDMRNTLFWDPKASLDRDGKAALSFYTSDRKGTYMIVVEGLDHKGNTAVTRLPFVVK